MGETLSHFDFEHVPLILNEGSFYHITRGRYLVKKMKEDCELTFFISLLKRPRWQTLSPLALEEHKQNYFPNFEG